MSIVFVVSKLCKVKEDSYNENWYDKSVKDLLGNIIKVANNATRL